MDKMNLSYILNPSEEDPQSTPAIAASSSSTHAPLQGEGASATSSQPVTAPSPSVSGSMANAGHDQTAPISAAPAPVLGSAATAGPDQTVALPAAVAPTSSGSTNADSDSQNFSMTVTAPTPAPVATGLGVASNVNLGIENTHNALTTPAPAPATPVVGGATTGNSQSERTSITAPAATPTAAVPAAPLRASTRLANQARPSALPVARVLPSLVPDANGKAPKNSRIFPSLAENIPPRSQTPAQFALMEQFRRNSRALTQSTTQLESFVRRGEAATSSDSSSSSMPAAQEQDPSSSNTTAPLTVAPRKPTAQEQRLIAIGKSSNSLAKARDYYLETVRMEKQQVGTAPGPINWQKHVDAAAGEILYQIQKLTARFEAQMEDIAEVSAEGGGERDSDGDSAMAEDGEERAPSAEVPASAKAKGKGRATDQQSTPAPAASSGITRSAKWKGKARAVDKEPTGTPKEQLLRESAKSSERHTEADSSEAAPRAAGNAPQSGTKLPKTVVNSESPPKTETVPAKRRYNLRSSDAGVGSSSLAVAEPSTETTASEESTDANQNHQPTDEIEIATAAVEVGSTSTSATPTTTTGETRARGRKRKADSIEEEEEEEGTSTERPPPVKRQRGCKVIKVSHKGKRVVDIKVEGEITKVLQYPYGRVGPPKFYSYKSRQH